jgi:oligopeptide transport system permease protein
MTEEMRMKKYILKRLIISFITLMIIILVLFLMLQFMPGSPFNDEKLTEAQVASMRKAYGLDKPIIVQFFIYVARVFTGDLGVSYSISQNTPVSSLLNTRVPVSFSMGLAAVVIGALLGLILGIAAATHHNSWLDTLCTVISVLGVALPSYVFGLILAYVFGYQTQIFPLLYTSDHPVFSTVLPVIALSMFTVATVARFTRSSMLEVLDSDYMLLAESKGVTGPTLIWKHAMRNVMVSVITVLAPLIVDLMIGSLVIEQIFAIPGIGTLMVTSIQSNDYNVTIAIALIYSVMYIAVMLIVDILYGIIDPRIRLAKNAN